MLRRSATTGLTAKASHILHEMVGVLSDPECGAAMQSVGNSARKVASWITRAVSSRSEFVMVPSRFFDKTKYVMMSGGQG